MKQEAKTNRGLLVLLAMILAVCLAMGLNAKNTYASSNPTLTMGNQGVLFLGTGEDEDNTIKLHNLPEDVISIVWKVDKPKIASLYVDKKNKTSADVTGIKSGTAKITATITYWADTIDEDGNEDVVKQTCTATKTIIVKKANGIKSLKIGSSSAKSPNTYEGHIYNNEKGKLKISMNKGWELSSVTFKDGKTKKTIKNGAVINSKKKSSALYITVKDSKTNASYKTKIPVDKYDIWKITYGKMKKNTSLVTVYCFASGMADPAWRSYSKKAKKNDEWHFKNIQDLTNKLSQYDAKRKGNVITLKALCNKGYPKIEIGWENPGKGCKVQYIKKVK